VIDIAVLAACHEQTLNTGIAQACRNIRAICNEGQVTIFCQMPGDL
jgi:siroheme synthase (precorrin-2 oxidase/ferrochelatase)